MVEGSVTRRKTGGRNPVNVYPRITDFTRKGVSPILISDKTDPRFRVKTMIN